MNLSLNKWLKIISYRDFFDVPRYMLVADDESEYWILECAFDETLDEYPTEFSILPAGTNLMAAEKLFDVHAKDPTVGEKSTLKIPLVDFEFDSTKRKECLIRGTKN